MRRIIVNANETVLVYKRGTIENVYCEGTYWIMPGRQIGRLTMEGRFEPEQGLNMVLENEDLAGLLDVIEIKDNEIALRYKDGLYKSVCGPGKFAFWKKSTVNDFKIIDLNDPIVDATLERKILEANSLAPFIMKVKVESYEKAILSIDGINTKILGPGTYYYWKVVRQIDIIKANLRKQVIELNGQEILTKDKAAIRVNIYAQYMITDVSKALLDVNDYSKQVYAVLQLAFRSYIGGWTLDELLAKKVELSVFIIEEIKEQMTALGIEILNCGIKDIILPGEIKDIMNQVLIAEKKAQANVIMRREETASTRSLLNTAKLMEDNSMLFKLKEMEYLEKIAESVNGITISGGGQVLDQLKDLFTKSSN